MIASQLDISKEEVDYVIKTEASEEERKEIASKRASAAPSVGMFYLDAVISIDLAIRHAQHSIWRALKGTVPEFNISVVEEAQNVQEMSLIIAAYGGYVLKYVGDSVLAFFPVNLDDKHLPCVNAVNCAQSMIKIIRQGINPILNEYDYPEIAVRIGIDIGENVVVQYSWRDNSSSAQSKDAIKKPHHDILGYTISIAAKMTTFAQSNQIVIGQFIYDTLDDAQKSTFKALQVRSDVWSYVSNITGEIYRIYASNVKK